ncbi:MAG: oligosaccharide flippase family protein [Lachnospiraceae bacterium]|nr:oligosaccharide flippase family protein [Lachnospiraceae bacterium]MDD3615140.1 oligosaccharide flippase family protein [Lachnospiraceae bacterium]
MSSSSKIIKGAFWLTIVGLCNRIIGFFYRIFLSNTMGATRLGIYQLIIPAQSLCLAISVGGIQTGITNLIAASQKKGDTKASHQLFACACFLTLLLSILISMLLYRNSNWIAKSLIKETRCAPLLSLLSLSIPFTALHSCIMGYYYARQETKVPNISNLIEQIIRVTATILVYNFLSARRTEITGTIALAGLLCGEIAAVLFSFLWYLRETKKLSYLTLSTTYMKKIILFSTPLTCNRLLLTLLNSFEALSIPQKLITHGYTANQALGLYGTLTGMTLPLLLFPTAITNAVSLMLLPSIAAAYAANDRRSIETAIDQTLKYCLILGIYTTGIFYLAGEQMGLLLFNSKACGTLVKGLAFLTPFLFLSTTLSSILHGLSKTTTSLRLNCIRYLIRISSIFLLVPTIGLKGYLWGLLISDGFFTLSSLLILRKSHPFNFSFQERIAKPALLLLLSISLTELLLFLTHKTTSTPNWSTLILFLGTLTLLYLIFLIKFKILQKK